MELLSVSNLNLSVGTEAKILNSSFTVESGDVLLLTGPNGCGKSTIIKLIMGATFDYKDIECSDGTILYKSVHDILHDEKENEAFRRDVCYISQEDEFESDSVLDCFVNSISRRNITNPEKYVFDFIIKHHIADCFGLDCANIRIDRKCKRLFQKLKLTQEARTDDVLKTVKYMTMSTKQLSGGQKKLTNIFSNLIRCEFCNLVILDEPINNLDYSNVRSFSNVLTRIYRSRQDIAMIVVTHCRSIPIINKVVEIDPVNKSFVERDTYICSSCFGVVNDEGMFV